jgi:hypothetical protein
LPIVLDFLLSSGLHPRNRTENQKELIKLAIIKNQQQKIVEVYRSEGVILYLYEKNLISNSFFFKDFKAFLKKRRAL